VLPARISGSVGAGPRRCIKGSQSILVARWSVVRDLNPGRRSTGGRRRREVGAPSRTAARCPPATGNENWARGVTGFFPPYTTVIVYRSVPPYMLLPVAGNAVHKQHNCCTASSTIVQLSLSLAVLSLALLQLRCIMDLRYVRCPVVRNSKKPKILTFCIYAYLLKILSTQMLILHRK